MGRRSQTADLETRVRAVRIQHGWSQGQLAAKAGLTRQAISSIEGGAYIPNTVVALRLAQALGCRVDNLFGLRASARPNLDVIGGLAEGARRLAVGIVGDRQIGYALEAGREMQQGFVSADALVPAGGNVEAAEYLTPIEQIENTAILLGCDPSLGILSAHVSNRRVESRLLWLSTSSQVALDAVARGEAHLAGTHLRDPDSATYNLLHARRALADTGGVVVEFARWEEGFVVRAGNPKGIHRPEDLVRAEVGIVNREPGSGSRALLDDVLVRAGLSRSAVGGYDRLASSHMAAAAAVATGGADAAVALRTTALAFGLDFVPLEEMRFDFVIPRTHLDHPTISRLLEVLQSAALRAEIGALPGYDVTGMGTVQLDFAVRERATPTPQPRAARVR